MSTPTVTGSPQDTRPRATPRSSHTTTRPAAIGAVARLARRTLRTNRWRNVLIVALILLPVAVATVVAVGARSSQLPDDAWAIARFGTVADARIHEHGGGTRYADLPDELQAFVRRALGTVPSDGPPLRPVPEIVESVLPGAPLLPLHEARLADPALEVTAIDLDDPVADGLFRTDAPAPTGREVLLSARAMDELDTSIGEVVTIADLGEFEVSGEVAHPFRARPLLAVTAPEALGAPNAWLVTTGGEAGAQALQDALDPLSNDASGIATPTIDWAPAVFRSVEPAPSPEFPTQPSTGIRRVVSSPSFVGATVGALLLVQVGLVAAAAFATGARRRVRQFGLLGTAGASPRQVGLVVLAEGVLLGAVGAALGVLTGLVLAVAGRPLVERVTGVPITAIDVGVTDLLAPALVGVAAAVVAAWWPARAIARTSTVSALAGRMPLRRVPRWVSPLALGVTAAGLLLMALASQTTGGLLSVGATALAAGLTAIGAASLGVPLLGLIGTHADRLPALPRLVARDALRQRTRSGAAVAALVVVLMLPVIAMSTLATDAQRYAPRPATPTVLVSGPHAAGMQLPLAAEQRDDVIAMLPDAPTATVDVLQLERYDDGLRTTPSVTVPSIAETSSYAPGGAPFVLATTELLDVLDLDEDARAHLAEGGLLDLAEPGTMTAGQRAAAQRPARLVAPVSDAVEERPLLAIEAGDVQPGRMVLVSQGTADALGLDLEVRSALLVLPRALDDEEIARVTTLDGAATAEAFMVRWGWSTGADDVWVTPIVLGAALLVALLIVGMTTALAATESDRDLATMTAVGADPRMRPRFHGLQATYHTLLAGLIATPAALLLFRAALGEGSSFPMVVPWLGILAMLVLVPGLVGCVLWAAMRPARPVLDRRIS